MTNEKIQEITEHDLRTGKYLVVGRPIVLITNHDRDYKNSAGESEEDKELKFQKSLEEAIGTVQVPHEAEFYIRGSPKGWAEIRKDKYISRDYTPVQFYALARFTVNVSSEVRSRIGNVSDRDCDRRAASISNVD